MSELFTIRPLEWRDGIARTEFGCYWLDGGQARFQENFAEDSVFCYPVGPHSGKAACEAHWRERIAACLVPAPED